MYLSGFLTEEFSYEILRDSNICVNLDEFEGDMLVEVDMTFGSTVLSNMCLS